MTDHHFISGLPRSGSTLLAGLLLQNPAFHAAMTSPVGSLVNAVLNVSRGNDVAVFMTEERTRTLARGVIDAYYADLDPGIGTVFDTNRQWCTQLPLIGTLFPQARVIACVRNPAWVLDSIEGIVRRNPLQKSRIFRDDGERATVYSRSDALARQDRLIGYAWSALKEAYYSADADRLLLVEYDILCQRPEETMRLIYQFIGAEWFAHDFDNVEYSADEFDSTLDTGGLHKVRRKVTWAPRRTVLPPDIFARFDGLTFWRENTGSRAHRIVQAEAPPPEPPEGG